MAETQRGRWSRERRKTPPFHSAMSMLVFYINRARSQLDHTQRERLEQAKDKLRALYGRTRMQDGTTPRAEKRGK